MNNEVQEKIIILNIMRWNKEEKGEVKKGTRISFIMPDNPSATNNFEGCAVIDQFYDDPAIFNKINKDCILAECMATFTLRSNNNPLKATRILSTLEFEDASINLV